MTHSSRTLVALIVSLAAVTVGARLAPACSFDADEEILLVTERHPDHPLRWFAQGHLGIVRPSYARSYLVVAYRYLAGMPLDRDEQDGAVAAWDHRGVGELCEPPWPPPPSPPPSRADIAGIPPQIQAWLAARGRVVGGPAPRVREGWLTIADAPSSGTANCLPDTFVIATSTVTARAKSYGAPSAALAQWVARQDAVFANCDGKAAVPVPPPPAGADALERADFAYQSAAASFYARGWDAAEKAFRAIAADGGSPWRMTARLLVVRTLVRRAVLAAMDSDRAGLEAARRELDQILADPTFAPIHEAARHYLPVVLSKLDRAQLDGDSSVRLGKGKLGKEFGRTLEDYAFLHGAEQERPPETSAPESDRLAHFIDTLRRDDFEAANRLYAKTRSPVWLAAALMTARPAAGAALDGLLAAAAAIDRRSPAYLTVRYHRLRLLAAIRKGSPVVAQELASVRRSLIREDGPSARNAFQALAFGAAGSLDELLAEAVAAPAGVIAGEIPIAVPIDGDRSLFPQAAETLSLALPTGRLVDAARLDKLSAPLQSVLLAATYLRAGVLDDRAAAATIAPLLAKRLPVLEPYLQRIEAAASEPQRRFELLYLLAKVTALSHQLPAWGTLTVGKNDELSRSGEKPGPWWCEVPKPPEETAEPRVRFLAPAEWATARREWARLRAFGSGPTFLNGALADVAAKIPQDERVAEALHIAVQGSRHGCTDDHTTAAARRAFTVLHKRFPSSQWTRRTPHYY